MKYNSEAAMCFDVMLFISKIFRKRNMQYIPEVPRASHNDHLDMLMIDRNKKCMLSIEFKLNDQRKLAMQCMGNPVNTIGIININKLNSKFDTIHRAIYSYNGTQEEYQKIHKAINNNYSWLSYQNQKASVYWWGYLNQESSFTGGIHSGKRVSYYELYKKAIFNLQETYEWKLDFYLVSSILRGVCSEPMRFQYFKEVMGERMLNQKEDCVVRKKDKQKFSIGEKVKVAQLEVTIKEFKVIQNQIFASTVYGDFNIDIISKKEE